MKALFRGWVFLLLRIYYPAREVVGRDALPSGPLVVVANHPNALLDPLVLWLAAKRPLRFLAKSTLFQNFVGRWALGAFEAIPVYRQRDVGGQPDPTRNDAMFAQCREVLSRGQAIALFPEGTSHSDPTLKPLKTGAARIVLSTLLDSHFSRAHGALALIPAGIGFEDKSVFRSRTHVRFGPPVAWDDLLPLAREDFDQAVRVLTERVALALNGLVLQAETLELLQGVSRVTEAIHGPTTPGRQAEAAQELLAAYKEASEKQPEVAEKVVVAARRYMRLQRDIGVHDAWDLQQKSLGAGAWLWAALRLVLLSPLWLLAMVQSYVPYRLAGIIAPKFTNEDDVLGTVKLLAGTVFLLATWIAQGVWVGLWQGALAGVAVVLCGPLLGYVGLRVAELAGAVKQMAHHAYLRLSRPTLVAALQLRRLELAKAVQAGLLALKN